MADDYIIRLMKKDEFKIAASWAAAEGWNPGIYDSGCFYDTDPEGFFMGLIDGKPISCISVVKYDKTFAFLGLYLVKKEFRGKGYGIRLWNNVLAHLRNMNIGLDGVVLQQENYKKSGFKLAYKNIRYHFLSRKIREKFSDVKRLSSIPFVSIASYDAAMFPASRSHFLKSWICQPESYSLGVLSDNKLAGYSVIRKCVKGYKIGPLFADNEKIAEMLFLSMNNFVAEGTDIFLDIPEPNINAIKLAAKYNMAKVFETARMYTKEEPKIPLDRIFGVTTFELG